MQIDGLKISRNKQFQLVSQHVKTVFLKKKCYRWTWLQVKCSVSLPNGAKGWCAVCDCEISYPYSLITFCLSRPLISMSNSFRKKLVLPISERNTVDMLPENWKIKAPLGLINSSVLSTKTNRYANYGPLKCQFDPLSPRSLNKTLSVFDPLWQCKKEGKDQESIKSSTTPDPKY